MKYLVTGGCGFVGSHLVEELVRNKHEVIAIDDLSHGKLSNLDSSLLDDKVKFINKDVAKPLDDIPKIDGIFHLACFHRAESMINPLKDIQINCKGMINALNLARKYNAKICFTSNSGLVGDIPLDENHADENWPYKPKTVYDADKMVSEFYCDIWNKEYNVDYVICRFSQIYGMKQNPNKNYKPLIVTFVKQMLRDEQPIIFGDGKQTRDLLFVKDAVNGIITAMKLGKNTKFHISSDIDYSVNQIYEICSKKLGFNKKPIHEKPRIGDIRKTKFSNKKAFDVLRWKPQFTLEQGIDRVIEYERRKLS